MAGAGRMARVHAGHLALEPDVQIAAACDHGSGRAAWFAATYGAAAYSDWRAMLDGTELDAVYICTPTAFHSEIGAACAERGLHIFVEKPLDLELDDAQRLLRAVEARGLLAIAAFQWRYTEAYRRAEELIGGDPVALVNLRWYWTRPPIRWMWDRDAAGGQIVDQNIHLLDAAQGLAGDVESVYAAYNERQVNFEPEFHNWDGYALTLKFEQGAVGACAGTYALFPEIQERPTADFALRDRLVRLTDQDVQLFTPAGVERWPNSEPLHRGVNRAFVRAMREGDPSHIRTPLRVGLRSTALALAANRSAQTGAPVQLRRFVAAWAEEEGAVGP
jgi:predicted dehydrogenase